jgi:hypothetical protein
MQGMMIEVHKLVGGCTLDQHRFAGADHKEVIEAAIAYAPEAARADLRRQLGPILEGAEPLMSYEGGDSDDHAWFRLRPIEVIA